MFPKITGIIKDVKADKTFLKLEGKTVLLECPSCHKSVHLTRLTIKDAVSLYKIPLKELKRKNILICPECASAFEYDIILLSDQKKLYPGDFKPERFKKIN